MQGTTPAPPGARAGRAPTSKDAEVPMQRMVDAIKAGLLDSFVPFDRMGRPVQFE